MTFWRSHTWQSQVSDAIQTTLDEQHDRLVPLNLSNGAWTLELMGAIGALARSYCDSNLGESAVAYRNSSASKWHTGGEFMFDHTWMVQRANPIKNEAALTVGIPLVLECEWLGWPNIWDDFDKLLLPRAGLRVMILQKSAKTPNDWADRLFARADAYEDASKDDAWLLCCWISKSAGFEYHRRIGGKRSSPLNPVATT